jgi:hypothetical protein
MQPIATTEQGEPQRPRLRGKPWPKGVSGNPSGSRVNTRAVVLFAEMAVDFGGVDALSGVDRAMLMQACRLMARGARAKSADDAVRLTSEARRILMALRKRVPALSAPAEPWSGVTARAQAQVDERRTQELAADNASDTPGATDEAAGAFVDGEVAADEAATSEPGEAEREARR